MHGSTRGRPEGCSPVEYFNPRRRPGRLPGELEAWHPVPHLGDRQAARAPPARYTLNERRLREKGMGEMEQAVGLLARTLKRHELVTDEGRPSWRSSSSTRAPGGCCWSTTSDGWRRRPFTRASRRARWLSRAHAAPSGASGGPWPPAGIARPVRPGARRSAWRHPRKRRADLRWRASYPSVQARAAHLLYFLIKDHPFSDGNKRIGTLLFLEYLRRNGMLVACGRRRSGWPTTPWWPLAC